MKTLIITLVSVLHLLLSSLTAVAQTTDTDFSSLSFTTSTGTNMPYRLHSPNMEQEEDIPLIIYLHGSGGWGNDNLKQISGGNRHGTRLWLTTEIASTHPAFVLAPQIPRPQRWSAPNSDELSAYAGVLIELIAQIKSDLPIDTNRIYLIGQSLGGMGVWDIVSKRPDIFAAGIPICGSGNISRIGNAKDIALWAFHGADDNVVPVQGSRTIVTSLETIGGNIKYTEYVGVGHNSFEKAFAEPTLPAWLFSNIKGQN